MRAFIEVNKPSARTKVKSRIDYIFSLKWYWFSIMIIAFILHCPLLLAIIFYLQNHRKTIAKSLGVAIDNKLDWSSHIDKLTKKVASGIWAIKRIRHLAPQATLLLIYQALIQPHFDYCNHVVWGNWGITLPNRVQKPQNRAPVFWLIQIITPMLVTCLSSWDGKT